MTHNELETLEPGDNIIIFVKQGKEVVERKATFDYSQKSFLHGRTIINYSFVNDYGHPNKGYAELEDVIIDN